MNTLQHSQLEKHYISVTQKDQILSFLRDAYDLDLTEYSEASVRRRLTKMLSEFGLKDVSELENFLSRKPDGRKVFIEKFVRNYMAILPYLKQRNLEECFLTLLVSINYTETLSILHKNY